MKNQASQQMFLDFNREFAGVTVTGDMITINVPSQKAWNWRKKNTSYQPLPPVLNLLTFLVLNKVAGIVRKYKPELKDELSGFLAALPGEVEAQELFVSQAFTPVQILQKRLKDISPETLTFLLSHTVKPFMKEYGRIMSSYYDPEQWLKGTCPVCGENPHFLCSIKMPEQDICTVAYVK